MKRNKLIEYGKTRAKGGAGPATLAIDFSHLLAPCSHMPLPYTALKYFPRKSNSLGSLSAGLDWWAKVLKEIGDLRKMNLIG
jgi:hypothetical protein